MPRPRRVRITRQAISPRLATRTVPKSGTDAGCARVEGIITAASHPEKAEGGLRQWGAGDDVQGQSQDGAGVSGVNDAVVPEAGSGIVGAALVLVLLPDGCLERRFVFGRPFLAA